MVPETIVLTSVCVYLTSVVDFKTKIPTRMKTRNMDKSEIYATLGSGLLFVGTIVTDVCIIFPHLQDPENGEFVFKYLKNANFTLLGVISAVGILAATALFLYARIKRKNENAKG